MRAKLERGERGALVAWPRLIHPDMNRDLSVVRLVDRGQRRAPIDSGEPARVAMGEHVHAAALTRGDVCDHGLPMMADQAAGFDILIRHLRGFRVGRRRALRRLNPAERLLHLTQRPVEIHGSGSRGGQICASAFEPGVGGVRLSANATP